VNDYMSIKKASHKGCEKIRYFIELGLDPNFESNLLIKYAFKNENTSFICYLSDLLTDCDFALELSVKYHNHTAFRHLIKKFDTIDFKKLVQLAAETKLSSHYNNSKYIIIEHLINNDPEFKQINKNKKLLKNFINEVLYNIKKNGDDKIIKNYLKDVRRTITKSS